MNADTFMQEFGHLAEAPGGVGKTREMVLQLAVQGKLVPQDREDERAEYLLSSIERSRNGLIESGKLRPSKDGHSPLADQTPFDLPVGWAWVQLGQIMAKMGAGSTPLGGRKVYVDDGVMFLRSQNVWNDGLRLDDVARILVETHERMSGTFIKPGDVLLNITGASIGRCGVVPDDFRDGNVSQHVAILRLIDKRLRQFLHLCVISPFFQETIMKVQVGVSREGLSMTRLRKFPFPVPPLAEQHRIVAKVDELMALCDELEVQQQKRRTVHVQLNDAALDRLTSAENDTDFKTAWTRVRSNFDLLYSVPENVNGLRQAILQLAVQGKLLPQDHTDDPASDVLARKYDLPEGNGCKRKILKKTQLNVPDGLLTPLPGSWEYVSIQQLYDSNIVINYADGNHGSLYPRKSEFGDEGVLYVTARDISEGRVNWSECPHLKESKAHELTKGWAKGGDVLLTHNATVGRVGRVEPEVGDFLLGTSVTFYRLNTAVLDADFFYFVLNSPVWQRQLEAVMKQTTRNQVSIQKQAFFQIPFPPPSEQKRIAARLDEYMALCDELESKLAQQQTDADRLTEAMVAAILDGTAAPVSSRKASPPTRRSPKWKADKPMAPGSQGGAADTLGLISCYAVERLHENKSFHRTNHAKILSMAQAHVGVDLGVAFERWDHGPFHPCIYELERSAAKNDWYTTEQGEKVSYHPGPQIDEAASRAAELLGDKQPEMDRLLKLFAGMRTRRAELIATTFFVWNDLLLDAKSPSDVEITDEFYNWHESKRKKFTPDKVTWAIQWLQENDMAPVGMGRKTVPRSSPDGQ